jgi:hypothetical protein
VASAQGFLSSEQAENGFSDRLNRIYRRDFRADTRAGS